MRKICIAILSCIYLLVSSGSVINLHYCMGKLTDVSFNAPAESNCNKCGMKTSSHQGCCHDQQKQLKLHSDQKSPSSEIFLYGVNHLAEANSVYPTMPETISGEKFFHIPAHGPPIGSGLPLFKLYCNYRI